MDTRLGLRRPLLAAITSGLLLPAGAGATHLPGFGHDQVSPDGQRTTYTCNRDLACLGLTQNNDVAAALLGSHPSDDGIGAGVVGVTNSDDAGAKGVEGIVNVASGACCSAGIRGVNANTGANGYGVWGSHAGSGSGGHFTSAGAGAGVSAIAGNGGVGVNALAVGPNLAYGVVGVTTSTAANAAGSYGYLSSNAANAAGVRGENFHSMCCGMGVAGFHGGQGIGVYGESLGGFAVSGFSPNNWSGYFQGNMRVVGNLQKNSGSFTIDHPLDPANKYLSHSFVESPDMKNVYDGVVRTDRRGFAGVKLPRYYQALNRDFRYQLTVIGEFAQAIVAKKIKSNRFTIRTDKPGVEVSWQVTGIRKDRWANAHRIVVEEAKKPSERGKYLNPELYGKPPARNVVQLPGWRRVQARKAAP